MVRRLKMVLEQVAIILLITQPFVMKMFPAIARFMPRLTEWVANLNIFLIDTQIKLKGEVIMAKEMATELERDIAELKELCLKYNDIKRHLYIHMENISSLLCGQYGGQPQ